MPHLFCNVEFEFSWFNKQHQTVIKNFHSQNRNAAWISKEDEYWNHWVLVNDFGLALHSSNIDLWNIDLLVTYTFTFVRCRSPFFCRQDGLETSSRYDFRTSSRHIFKTSSRHAFKTPSRHVFKMSWRRLHCNNFSSSKTSWKTKNSDVEDVLKRFSRHVFKTNTCLLGRLHRNMFIFVLKFPAAPGYWVS